jgi:hypothetical protein
MSIASQLSFSTATSLLAGAAGSIPYQSATSSTTFLAIGTNGYVLTSNGSAPYWAVSSGGGAGGSSTSTNTVLQTANANYYPTFVDSNNASSTGELFYTTSSFSINPTYGSVGIGNSPSINSYGSATASYKLNLEYTPPQNTTIDDILRLSSKFVAASNTASAAIGSGPAIVFAGGIGDNQSRDRARIAAVYEGSNVSGLAFHTQTDADNIAERVRIRNNGNVGIGTISPSYKLTVAGANSSSTPLVQFNATGTGTFQRGVQLFNTALAAGESIMYSVGTADSSRQMGQMYYYYAGSNSTSNRLSLGLHSVDDVLNVLGSGNVMIGTTTDNGGKLGVNGEIRSSNEITAYYSSDSRLKENVRVIANPLEKLEQIRGVYFDWKDEHIQTRGGEDGYFVRKQDVGVIAQEVEAVLPEIVATRDNGTKVVKYEKLVALLIEAVKEQQQQINQISQQLAKLAVK